MCRIITLINDIVQADSTLEFDTLDDALTALELVGLHLGTFTGATVDDTVIVYWDDYTGCKTTLEVIDG